jgi:hypothetical protein
MHKIVVSELHILVKKILFKMIDSTYTPLLYAPLVSQNELCSGTEHNLLFTSFILPMSIESCHIHEKLLRLTNFQC